MSPSMQVPVQQTKTSLLSIPAELRVQIYQQLLLTWVPNGRVHVVPAATSQKAPEYSVEYAGFRYVPCLLLTETGDKPSLARTLHWDNCQHCDYLLNVSRHIYPGEQLGIFSTCKQIAEEIVPMIPSSFTLDFETFADAHAFLSMLPPDSLNTIRGVHITGDIPRVPYLKIGAMIPEPTLATERELYLDVCKILKRMERLQHLRINFRALPRDKAQWTALCETLGDIKVKEEGQFVVKLPTKGMPVFPGTIGGTEERTEDVFDRQWPFRIETRGWNFRDPLERERELMLELERRSREAGSYKPAVNGGWRLVSLSLRRLLGRDH